MASMVASWTGKDELRMLRVIAGLPIFLSVFMVTRKSRLEIV